MFLYHIAVLDVESLLLPCPVLRYSVELAGLLPRFIGQLMRFNLVWAGACNYLQSAEGKLRKKAENARIAGRVFVRRLTIFGLDTSVLENALDPEFL
jgi:hypothetical protein